ncbi:abhydrolase domain-containing protein 4-like, partial [Trifolium medium]|nr:abhydrolase domain-containing protein 4-like [Trifolium medium]
MRQIESFTVCKLCKISIILKSASEWKVTTFIYGFNDWMNYEGAQEARKHMKVPCEIIWVPQ